MRHDLFAPGIVLFEEKQRKLIRWCGENLLTLANLLDESFGLGLLVADFIVVQGALRQDDLDPRCRADSG